MSLSLAALVTAADYKRLVALARSSGQSNSTFLRGLINDGLEQEGAPPLEELRHEKPRRKEAA